MVPKNFGTPLAHGRKVFGMVSNHVLTPAVHPQERKLHKPQVGTNLSIYYFKFILSTVFFSPIPSGDLLRLTSFAVGVYIVVMSPANFGTAS